MKKLILISVFLLPFLTGCGFLKKFQKDDTVLVTPKILAIDRETLKECERLVSLEKREITLDEIGQRYIQLIGQYGICSNRQANSVKVIKELANIKD